MKAFTTFFLTAILMVALICLTAEATTAKGQLLVSGTSLLVLAEAAKGLEKIGALDDDEDDDRIV